MSARSTSNKSPLIASYATTTATITSTSSILSQNSVLLDIGEPSSAIHAEFYDEMTGFEPPPSLTDDDNNSIDSFNSSNNGNAANKQVIFLLFLK